MQILDNAYKCLSSQPWQASINTTTGDIWRNQNLHFNPGAYYKEMPAVLMKIPKLVPYGTTGLAPNQPNFEIHFYIDYNIEMEFIYGDYSKIRNGPYTSAPYGTWNSGGYGSIKLHETIGDMRKNNVVAESIYLGSHQTNYDNTYSNVLARQPPQQQAVSYITSAWDFEQTVPAALATEERIKRGS